jgi:hypothetical protein
MTSSQFAIHLIAKGTLSTHRLAQLLDESHGLPLQAPLEPAQHQQQDPSSRIRSDETHNRNGHRRQIRLPPAGTRGEELDEVVGGHVEEGVEVHAAVAVLAERPLLRLACGRHLPLDIDVRLRRRKQAQPVRREE